MPTQHLTVNGTKQVTVRLRLSFYIHGEAYLNFRPLLTLAVFRQ